MIMRDRDVTKPVRTDSLIFTATIAAFVLAVLFTGCKEEGLGCEDAWSRFLDHGCRLYDPFTLEGQIAKCNERRDLADSRGCSDEFDAYLRCLGRAVPPECSESCAAAGSLLWRCSPGHEMTQVQFSGVDILVVVDNSLSMEEEQASLTSSFPLLIQSLLDPQDLDGDTRPDHVPVDDLHIGVVSTDMGTGGYPIASCPDPIDGDNGELQHTPNPSIAGCETAYPTYLSYEEEEPDVPAIDLMSTGFGCTATLGNDGCGWEQPLKAAAKALIDHRDGVNAGFLRPDSILTILFVTDEEDCSVAPGSEGIFDASDASLGHMDLRCFNHPDMVEPIDTYISVFQSLRADPAKLVLAFIVGVPQTEQCEGFGDAIPTCLDHPDMIERVDMPTTSILPACTSASGSAPPGRRFVEIAESFGENALVQSICADDFGPAIQALTNKLHEIVDSEAIVRELTTMKDPEDACRCLADCEIIEALSDIRSCDTVGKPCYEPDGPGTGCSDPEIDPDGLEHTLCLIPQAGTRMSPCTVDDPPECDDPGVTHSIDGLGWYYYGRNWSDGTTTYVEPQILFTEGMEPEEGSNVYIQCESFICPENRQCGPEDDRVAVCCNFDEYCLRGSAAADACPPGESQCCWPRPD